MQIDFNTDILNTLLSQQTDKAITAAARFPKIDQWREKQAKPTFNQLVGLANYFNIPFGYFFLAKFPYKPPPITHYRSDNKLGFTPSENLVDTIETLEERQEWARTTLSEHKEEPLAFANTLKVGTPLSTAVDEVRKLLNLPENWLQSDVIKSWTDVFKILINKTEAAGIFVVINGVVNNNTHRKLEVKEFRGFVLYDDYAPFVFVNNNDFISGKIFTLIHEIVHVLLGKSASFDFSNLLPAGDAIEQYCDAVSAEFLVPARLLLRESLMHGNDYEKLARRFHVSRIIIARRLYDIRRINHADFIENYDNLAAARGETLSSDSTGGNFYNTAPYRISKRFFMLIYSSINQNKLLYRDAFRLTGLKSSSFDGYIKEHINTKPK